MDRALNIEYVEGEIALIIEYVSGESEAIAVLQGAMRLIESLDALDHCLLSSINTSLEPVSILNDVQHSSLKILLARALKKIPDELVSNLDWKKWVGGLLVKGKYKLLKHIDSDAPVINQVLIELEPEYKSAPMLVGYQPPRLVDVQDALGNVSRARSALGNCPVTIQTEFGDVVIPNTSMPVIDGELLESSESLSNKGREYLKVKSPDMLGNSQWTVVRGGRSIKIDMLHAAWLENYHQGKIFILPGDSLDCSFEETIFYDGERNEIGRKLSVIEVFSVVRPPKQSMLHI